MCNFFSRGADKQKRCMQSTNRIDIILWKDYHLWTTTFKRKFSCIFYLYLAITSQSLFFHRRKIHRIIWTKISPPILLVWISSVKLIDLLLDQRFQTLQFIQRIQQFLQQKLEKSDWIQDFITKHFHLKVSLRVHLFQWLSLALWRWSIVSVTRYCLRHQTKTKQNEEPSMQCDDKMLTNTMKLTRFKPFNQRQSNYKANNDTGHLVLPRKS